MISHGLNLEAGARVCEVRLRVSALLAFPAFPRYFDEKSDCLRFLCTNTEINTLLPKLHKASLINVVEFQKRERSNESYRVLLSCGAI